MRFKQFLLENDSDLKSFETELQKKYGLTHLRLYKKGNDLTLDMIVVPKDKRKQGIGSKVLEDITHYADVNGLRTLLTTAVKDDYHGTTSGTRLKSFYKKFGFVENKGRNKDFTTTHNMIREPKKNVLKESEERKLLKKTRTGKIYELSNGNILKISNDELEFKNAKILISKPSKQFIKYYSAEKVDNNYEMEMQRIIPLKDNEVEVVDLIQNSLGDSDYFLNDTRRNKFIQELKNNKEWYESFATYKEVYKFVTEIYNIYKEGKRLGIDLFNINSENVGHTKDGRLVAFDLGN